MRKLIVVVFVLATAGIAVSLPWWMKSRTCLGGIGSRVEPLGLVERIGDVAMLIVRDWHVTGWGESPHRTHPWNSCHFSEAEAAKLQPHLGVAYKGDPAAGAFYVRRPSPYTEKPLPFLRKLGWRKYIVVVPAAPIDEWYVGVAWEGGTFFSRIPVKGAVRLLIGPGDAYAFGLNAEGEQIQLLLVGKGELGDGGEHRHVSLR